MYENHTVRLHGRVIDIPKRSNAARAAYAGKEVVVKHLLSGDYRVFHDEECICVGKRLAAEASQQEATRTNDKDEQLG